jgi:hypothetical protein
MLETHLCVLLAVPEATDSQHQCKLPSQRQLQGTQPAWFWSQQQCTPGQLLRRPVHGKGSRR